MQYLLFLIPLAPLLGFVFWMTWMARASRRDRTPLTDRLLRAPGHSLALRVEVLHGQFFERLALVGLLATVSAGLTSQIRPLSHAVTVLLIMALLQGFLLFSLHSRFFELRNHARGLIGERAVGETLGALRADGCHVFHDLVHEKGERSFNIDHIVVGPQGVFAIETKYRRKQAVHGQLDYKMDADAHTLHFPAYVDRESIPQAEQNAEWLAVFLRKATAEPVKVRPIVTLPGWYVNVRERNGVPVLNEKQIAGYIRHLPKTVPPDQIQRIAHQLDQRCRDVAV